ncbi:hypothetical protein TFLX_00649 [Thermoflexales bacterium]|nr:hypothetical protein TFLX_00649 [Thermoflexales bacterium]
MPRAIFRFYQELNDFLPPPQRQIAFEYEWRDTPSIKHLIEALGVPHTEVDLILVNDRSVDWAYQPQQNDRVAVYPVFESLDITPLIRLRPQPLREVRFVLDGHLGRLAAYLRMLGFDTGYQNHVDDAVLAQISKDEQRILLTRDQGLLKRSAVTHGYWVRATAPREQLREVIARFDLQRLAQPFTRCLSCNGLLQAAALADVKDEVPENAVRFYAEFWRCASCHKIYWPGSHYQRMVQLIEEIHPTAEDAESAELT